ncbi:MAG: TetR/AcrR family transcriptional regulator [Eubacteriales bacterium]|nr:TetR/AcrR family transcriptional regulator [Eubacteriales bacterium]
MPRDKTEAHEKIVKAAMHEFLTKGFEQASMKSVADEVGMTSAGLYRHFKDKQDMFAELVKPGIALLDEWYEKHKEFSYREMDKESFRAMWDISSGINDGALILDVMYQMPEVFRLIVCCSAGTPYENYIHDMVESATDEMMTFLAACRKNGIKTYDIKRDEMHMLISAYMSALLQPIEHGYSKEDAKGYLKTMMDFFTPGWRMITAL